MAHSLPAFLGPRITMLNAHLLFIFGFSLCCVGESYLLIPPAFPREAHLWLADSAGGKLPTTTRTGHFPAWSFACKRREELVRLMKETFPWEWAGTTQPPLEQHSCANLSSNLPHPERQRDPREAPTATGREFGKEQPPNPPPRCGQRCLQPSPLCAQSAADGGYLIQPRWPCTDADMEQPHGQGTGKEA